MRESRMMKIQRMAHRRIARVIRRMQRAVAEAKAAGTKMLKPQPDDGKEQT